MGISPPYLFNSEPASVSVHGEDDGAVTVLTVAGAWDRRLWREVSTALGKCLAEHPAALLIDLTSLDDVAAESAPTWVTAQGTAANMVPPVQMAICVSPELVLADRLQRMGARRFLPIYAKARQARVALNSRLPLTERLLLHLAPDPDAAGRAGKLVSDACRAWEMPHMLHAARLIVSELVTNAVEHAGTSMTVMVSRRGAGIHLAVSDGEPCLPHLLPPDDLLDGRGRGLRTVHEAATLWGAMPTPDGKLVWATIRPVQDTRRSATGRLESFDDHSGADRTVG
jgi:hypothetical protein